MGLAWQLDFDRVAGAHRAPRDDGAHDAGFANKLTVWRAVEHGSHQPGLKAVELSAGIAKTRKPDNCSCADVKLRVDWQRQQIDSLCSDIFTQHARRYCEALRDQFRKKFRMHEMDLS